MALVIDCHTRELLGWHLSRSGKAATAASALEHALISRFGTLGKVAREFLLRSDNGLVFTSRKYTALVRSYGLKQEFITPHCPQQNGMVERVIQTLKEQCIHRQRYDSIQHAIRTGLERAIKNAGLEGVSSHVLRHTAAVHMAEAGIPMTRISQYLGHSSTAVTERVYARFAPDHLADAAAVLEFGSLNVV